ncbi:MAG: hypothetical protein JWQ27_209 [Ferruginibacter sp.]|nr:hypothetical protein [Ferruginibacter sp.]
MTTLLVAYAVFTIRYNRVLRKNEIFSKGLRIFHQIMIWLVPFVWALLLKGLSKSAPGSHEVDNKVDPQPFSKTGGTMWSG